MNKKLNIAFFGTPEFAIPSLDIIIRNGYSVCVVVTAPDKPAGRNRMMHQSAVKQYAIEKGLKLMQPVKLDDKDFINEFRQCDPDLMVVVAFRILPEVIWSLPRLGAFNLHASLLPQYRGAAPINHAIINGENETGVTTFFLDKHVDTGNIILQKKVPISEEDNAGTLHDRLMMIGAELVLETIQNISSQCVSITQQKEMTTRTSELNKAPKLTKEFCRINWKADAHIVYNFIRGLSPYPSAWTIFNSVDKQIQIKIKRTSIEIISHELEPGKIIADGNSLKIAVKDGFIHIIELQQAGKKMMSASNF